MEQSDTVSKAANTTGKFKDKKVARVRASFCQLRVHHTRCQRWYPTFLCGA